jgi:Zn-dependent protease
MSQKVKGIRIGGFKVTVEPLLPVVIVIIGWLLSERYFPTLTMGYYSHMNYILGGIASIMLTFSILFHELGHAFMAVKLKLQIERIHLYLFGGMAELKHRPIFPRQELFVALSGPLASFLLSGFFYLVYMALPLDVHLTRMVFKFLVQINFLLAAFNLIPIFPLDGGRSIRALFWFITRRYYSASIGTLYLSYIIIAGILIFGIIDWSMYSSGFEYIILLMAFYLGYTVWSGHKELLHQPDFRDLILEINHLNDATRVIEQILRQNKYFLARTVVPIVNDTILVNVIRGRMLQNASITSSVDPVDLVRSNAIEFMSELTIGDFIEIQNHETFDTKISYSADFVPVTKAGRFLGLCDAYEMRFWLLENHKDVKNQIFYDETT